MTGSTSPGASSGSPEVGSDLQDLARQIHQEFDARLDPDEIDECLDRVAAKFDDAKVRSFVPLLVGRYVRDELSARLVNASA